jgi:ubiquitin carboxyl-terminal hydrolase 1
MKVAAEVATLRGLGELITLQGHLSGKQVGRIGQDGGKGIRQKRRGLAMPWEGLMARQRVCKVCGWCETIRMDTLGGMELAIPQSVRLSVWIIIRKADEKGEVNVEDCIGQYLAPELLSDVTCEMCSLRQTYQHYAQDSERLASPPSSINGKTSDHSTQSGSFSALEHVKPNTNGIESNTPMTSSRKKRAKETKRVETRLKEMLDSGTITHFGESSIPPTITNGSGAGPLSVKWQTVRSDSIREAAITRPPQSLRLHFIRSEYTPYGQLLKKNARVNFPMILDLTRFVANGVWEERNIMSMLSTDTPPSPQPKVLYRLESVILHYGYNHSSGHYICIRRKPSLKSEEGFHRPMGVKKTCKDGCRCDACSWFGQVREEKEERGKGWLRISDADVDEVGIEALVEARSAVFMVFYEKVGEYEGNHEELDGQETREVEKGLEGQESRKSV